jgi:hypothetical protein
MMSSEVFPDLQLRMSKKIAQLTKVIYHLNTRNEDHQVSVVLHRRCISHCALSACVVCRLNYCSLSRLWLPWKAEIDALVSNHQVEVKQLLRDATAKINRLREQLDARHQQVSVMSVLGMCEFQGVKLDA